MTGTESRRNGQPRWPAIAAVALSASALAGFLRYGGGARREALPGLVDPGAVTAWALPAARLGTQLFAVATIGLLLAAAVLSPRGHGGMLSATGYRRLRAAAWTALLWCACSVAALCYTLADLLGVPFRDAVTVNAVVNFATTVPLGRALALSAWLAAAVFLICRTTLRVRGTAIALALALLAVVPPLFTGHAAAAANHQLAVSGLVLHVVPVTVWAGGLLALVLSGRASAEQQTIAVRRFSRIALACITLVAVSGLLSAYVRLPAWSALLDSRYGQLVVVKTVLLGVLAGMGWWHRVAALPALAAGNRRRFTLTAIGEILVFAAAMGTAVALSRTPTPPRPARRRSRRPCWATRCRRRCRSRTWPAAGSPNRCSSRGPSPPPRSTSPPWRGYAAAATDGRLAGRPRSSPPASSSSSPHRAGWPATPSYCSASTWCNTSC